MLLACRIGFGRSAMEEADVQDRAFSCGGHIPFSLAAQYNKVVIVVIVVVSARLVSFPIGPCRGKMK